MQSDYGVARFTQNFEGLAQHVVGVVQCLAQLGHRGQGFGVEDLRRHGDGVAHASSQLTMTPCSEV